MQMTVGEIVDRYTIERRKWIYGHGDENLLYAIDQYMRKRFGNDACEFLFHGVDMALFNSAIAELEWQIRAGKKLSLEEIGRRAVVIRELNSHRTEARDRMCLAFGERPTVIHYGKGNLKAEELTLDVQEPALGPVLTEASAIFKHLQERADIMDSKPRPTDGCTFHSSPDPRCV